MRGVQSAITACIFRLPLLILCEPLVPSGPPAPFAWWEKQSTTSVAASLPTTIVTASIYPASPTSTTTETIDVTSVVTPSSSTSVVVVPTSSSVAGEYPTSSLTITSMPASSISAVTPSSSDHHRKLVIVLSSVLGFVGLVLIACVLFFISRYRQRKSPFGRRGVSPINDDEIASWRKTGLDQKQQFTPPPTDYAARPEMSTIPPRMSPSWSWTASPTSVHTVTSPLAPGAFPPAVVTKAPNSRAGLTDETVPGADPFIALPKRQSSRLSKPHPGHSRSKSGRSSFSAKSIASSNGRHRDRGSSESKEMDNFSWFDPEDESVSGRLRADRTSSSVGASTVDGFGFVSGGLSPRPQPRPWEPSNNIGRAIT